MVTPITTCPAFGNYTWATGRSYAEQRYDEACAEAWNHFLAIGGFSLAGERENETGTLKDPEVQAFLMASGGNIADWKKWEWGPFAITLNGEDESSAGMWPIEMFETVDDRIPSNWVCRYDEDGFLNLAPASWLVEGFWGQDYSTRPISLEERRKMNADYKRELEIIKRECG